MKEQKGKSTKYTNPFKLQKTKRYMVIKIILSILLLCLSYPSSKILAKYTKDEKNLYKRYFPSLIWILAVLSAASFFINATIAFTLTFMFLTILFWNKF